MRAPTQQPTVENGDVYSAEFTLTLANFEGPFDLLLSLISRRKLDITDVALAEVTDEFLHFISALFDAKAENALDTASDFLVTAATLLDLKAARLLPQPSVKSEEDIALLEARDLLFARLLQYRAYREVTSILSDKYADEAQRFPRDVTLEPQFAQVLPELVFEISPEEFAHIAANALKIYRVGEDQQVSQDMGSRGVLEHLREPLTTIAAEETFIVEYLQSNQESTFSQLIDGSSEFEVAVFRFLALLELLKNGTVLVNQEFPLGEIKIRVRQEEGESLQTHSAGKEAENE